MTDMPNPAEPGAAQAALPVESHDAAPSPVVAPSRLSADFLLTTLILHLLISLIVMGDVLFSPDPHLIVGQAGQDTTSYNMPQGQFIQREMRADRLPLWNPYIFCGLPLLGNFNSALFYPLTWFHKFASVESTWNWNAMITFALAATFTTWWARFRGIGMVGAILAGWVYAWTGPLFTHLLPGHIQLVDGASWMPLVMLSIDGILETRRLRWALIGAGAVGLQILSGFPQVVFITGLMAVVYCLFVAADEAIRHARGQKSLVIGNSWSHWLRLRVGAAGLCCVVFLGGVMLGAVQLLPGLRANEESVRANAVSYDFATTGQNAPPNLLQGIAPRVFGDFPTDIRKESTSVPILQTMTGSMKSFPGVFVTFPWEAHCFVGISTVFLALFGLVRTFGCRQGWLVGVMILLLIMISFGSNLPTFHRFLFDHLPGFTSFRSPGRFVIPATLLISIMAGMGVNELQRKVPSWFLIVMGVGLAWLAWTAFRVGDVTYWKTWVQSVVDHADKLGLTQARVDQTPDYYAVTAKNAQQQLMIAIVPLVLLAGVVVAMKYWKPAVWAMLAVAVLDIGYGVITYRYYGKNEQADAALAPLARDVGKIHRILFGGQQGLYLSNQLMGMGYPAAYGYEPILTHRTAEYLAGMQMMYFPPGQIPEGLDPNKLNNAPGINFVGQRSINFLRLMRVAKYIGPVLVPKNGQLEMVQGNMAVPDPAPRLMLVNSCLTVASRDEVLKQLGNEGFDPFVMALLEREPSIKPEYGPVGPSPSILKEDTDHLEIEVELTHASLLIVTDTYSQDWRIRPLDEKPPQESYEIIPAYHTFRAVPLAAGKHHFLMEYAPKGFANGLRMSMVGWAGWLICIAVLVYRKFFMIKKAKTEVAVVQRVKATIVHPGEPSPFARKDDDDD